ncbi:hypothetical protein PRZ48_005188 [Zasmidium cellare]|uniref:N-acetyltransferase domain-containing protein n=1 Tax=Zasmidium cellare TaxID=395010 RepID=A0ABR0ERQ8_ZASCE|nr:hypothetical protein PRZ48_005188 [Zasmidium cellare]
MTIEIREADANHVESLKTILARSFFPVNDVVKKALPDNSEMRDWWGQVYSEEIDNPSCHPIIAVNTEDGTVIGVVCLRRMDGSEPMGGFWSKHPWTDSHSRALWQGPVDCMVAWEEKLMKGQPQYYLLELLAVDHAYKGQGVGDRLVRRACEVADKERLSIFLQSGSAKNYYLKLGLGFRIEVEPEWDGYKACIIVRPRPGSEG